MAENNNNVVKEEIKKEEKEEIVLEEETVIASSIQSNEEMPEDPVIPADAEAQGADRIPSNISRVVTSTKPHMKNQAIGNFTENYDQDRDMWTQDEIEDDEWRQIKKAARISSLLYGKVIAVIPEPSYKSFSVITSVFGKQVKIPEDGFITRDSLHYDRYYEGQTEDVKYLMRQRRLESYIGSLIPFVLISVNRQKIQDKSSTRGFYFKYFLGGSRLAGMEILQDYWFFHEKWKYSRAEMPEVKEGMIIEGCNVLTAHENGITVEICGVETYIEKYELITTKFMDNASDEFHPGQKINVMITKIRFNNEPGKPRVVLRGSLRRILEEEGKAAYDDVVEGGLYKGTVSSFSVVKKNYVIMLDVGVKCIVNPQFVEGYAPLEIGDVVTVRVNLKQPEFMQVRGRVIFTK